ncbi:MAG TPA: zinc ABC transporter substrate-binding protein, partial [Treponema sp.]|nr:zinc ABC transporter substrate-binding protein [Treponema sp.]
PGCATDVEVNAQTMKFLINKVRQENIPVVFSIELSNGKIADAICEATGAERQTLYSCHNLTAQEFSAGESYVSFMQKNVEALKKALD